MEKKKSWVYMGDIKVYNEGRVIYTKAFYCKLQLQQIMNRYQGKEMSVMFRDQENIIDKKYK